MLTLEHFMNIHLLRTEGHSIREISRLTGSSRNTVRKILKQRSPQSAKKRIRSTRILSSFEDYLQLRFTEHRLSAVRLNQEIRTMGYRGSVDTVRSFLRGLKVQQGAISSKLTVRYETPPGRQAQCDWAEIGRFQLLDGRRAYVHAFVMLLSYSRYLYAHFTLSMRREVLIDCHHRAFEFFGGIPETILYDNLKTVMNTPYEVNPEFADFALYYGIGVKNHRPYRPRTKGKVERAVSYLKDNFLRGRCFHGLQELNGQLVEWLAAANSRVHATTGRIPKEALKEEPLQAFDPKRIWSRPERVQRRVNAEALVQHAGSFYSVPAQFCGRVVKVQAHSCQIQIRCDDLIIASHPKAREPGSRIEVPEHVKERWELSTKHLKTQADTPPLCKIHFEEEQVEQRPLSIYEQEAA
jgi:transposase